MLLTDQPIKTVLHRLDISRWIAKWALELVKLDVQYHPKLAIKAQVLADFIFECIIPNRQSSQDGERSRAVECSKAGESSRYEETDIGSDLEELWTLHVNGSSNAFGARAGLILTDLEGDVAGYALRYKFLATNNTTEYEALLVGLKVVREARAPHLKVFNDFQLVMGHIKGGYKTREENIKKISLKDKRFNLSLSEL
ncbi:uncharacterized protein [Elaeis guineensis]|uniref:uncharacterized protein n=1 Tax=Elaeis guineensis var. tenera TaxID=51953 RepID=UPI003C6D2CF7